MVEVMVDAVGKSGLGGRTGYSAFVERAFLCTIGNDAYVYIY